MRSANVRMMSKNEEPVVLLGRTQIVMLTNKCGMVAGECATIMGESGGKQQWRLLNGRAVNKHQAGTVYSLGGSSSGASCEHHVCLPRAIAPMHSQGKKCQQCKYRPDRTTLMVLVCENCGRRKDKTGVRKSVSSYNPKRRQLRTEQQLVSAAVPLDRDSAWFVHGIIDKLGLTSNTAMPHVTFVEGLHAPPPPAELHNLWLAMKDEPQLTIVNAICIPTRRDKGMELVCLELQMGSALEVATRSLALHERCRLPQWPLHLALGVAAAAQACAAASTLCQTYRGRVMCVAVEQFCVLTAPTPCTAPPPPPPPPPPP